MTHSENELDRIKSKYLQRAEEFDRREEELLDHANLLQRMLVRVSLAAEGQDQQLDSDLSGLRQILREETPKAKELTRSLEKIEATVLALEEKRSDSASAIVKSLDTLTRNIGELDLPSDLKKKLKKLAKLVRVQQVQFSECPALLAEYTQIQSDVLGRAGQSPRKSEPGFLQKLFGGMGESGREPGSPAQIHDTQQPGMDSASTLAVDKDSDLTTSTNSNGGDRRYSEQETELDVSEPELSESDAQHHQGESESTEEAPGFSKVAGHISKSIRQLLEHLSVPSSSQREFQAILQRIEHGLNWYELGPTLDDVTNLVVSAVGKGQKDFESFLQLLDERLAMLQQFLTDSHAFKVAIQSSGAELDEAVREQVKSISALVSEATEIDTLKSSVNSQLDHILTLMTKFMTSESIKEKTLGEQISSMSEKLQSMETETQAIKEQLKVERGKALTDALTGLPNREAYSERIDLEYTRWQRYRQPMSLVITDIDLFKQVNDNYGHLAGDKVIQIMAKELQRRIRKTDFIARYGGEEFVIIMPETASDVAFTVMNKTRQMVERLPFHFRNQRVQITMSFGIAPFKDGLSMDEIFELADGALYKAKEQGRNCVVVEGMDGRGPIHA